MKYTLRIRPSGGYTTDISLTPVVFPIKRISVLAGDAMHRLKERIALKMRSRQDAGAPGIEP
ncbi:MAG: hypothetical protein K2X77_32835 [Candidatus Obscuribacterales bacterium]|jgi:hypothetical protein|nr:hypothetical protein [Candidatus Obscuribacterales bacterium]